MDRPVYLNNAGAAWPLAPGVSQVVKGFLDAMPTPADSSGDRHPDVASECRQRLAAMLKVADPSRVVLTQDATFALNVAIFGLGLNNDSRVVCTVTEHSSALRPLYRLKRRYPGIRIVPVGLGPEGALDMARAEAALREGPTLLILNHASNVTGRINEAERLFRLARASGAFTLLDAAQTLGQITCHAEHLHADLVAFTAHKCLHGPPGVGGLYVRPGLDLEPFCVGGTDIQCHTLTQPEIMPARLEAGSPSAAAFAGLAQALQWQERHGAEFARRARTLADLLRNALASVPGVDVVDADGHGLRTPIVSIRLDGWKPDLLSQKLYKDFGVISKAGLHCAPLMHEALGTAPEGTVRFSVSGFNTESEIEAAVRAVKNIPPA
ncbi:MAG: aminotransferase class V-fold PLP-dependent enzyme [Deltaproteobacteria bacterium]|nr:aminotransferase class V-fold PLP-dependent enzyme [Deltaproteobacteria bacterium]